MAGKLARNQTEGWSPGGEPLHRRGRVQGRNPKGVVKGRRGDGEKRTPYRPGDPPKPVRDGLSYRNGHRPGTGIVAVQGCPPAGDICPGHPVYGFGKIIFTQMTDAVIFQRFEER